MLLEEFLWYFGLPPFSFLMDYLFFAQQQVIPNTLQEKLKLARTYVLIVSLLSSH